MRASISLRFSSRSVAVWTRGGDLVSRRGAAVVVEASVPSLVHRKSANFKNGQMLVDSVFVFILDSIYTEKICTHE